MEGLFFYLFGTLAVISALATVTRRDAVTSAFWLIFCFLCVAALFALLSAHFMAILQILHYAGAIMVFFLFVTMFLGKEKTKVGGGSRLLPLLALVTLIGAGLVMTQLMRGGAEPFPEISASYGSIEWVSEELLVRYLRILVPEACWIHRDPFDRECASISQRRDRCDRPQDPEGLLAVAT